MRKAAIGILLLIMVVGFYLVIKPSKQPIMPTQPTTEQPTEQPTEQQTVEPQTEQPTVEQPTEPTVEPQTEEQPQTEQPQTEETEQPQTEGGEATRKRYVDYGRNYGTGKVDKDLVGVWERNGVTMTIKGDKMRVEDAEEIRDFQINASSGKLTYEKDRQRLIALYHIDGDKLYLDSIEWRKKQ